MEEWLVCLVVEVGRNRMEPYDSFSGVDVDKAEPVVLLDTRSFADSEGSVGVDSDSVPAEYEHAAQSSESPGFCGSTKRRLIDTGGRDGNDFDVRGKVG